MLCARLQTIESPLEGTIVDATQRTLPPFGYVVPYSRISVN